MKRSLKAFNDFFLAKIDKNDLVRYKKARFFMIMGLMSLFFLTALSFASLYYGYERFIQVCHITVPAFFLYFLCLYLIRKGKFDAAVNCCSISGCILVVAGFFSRPPETAGVTLGYFMYVDLVFATMFSSILISSVIFVSFITTHAVYYFLVASPVVTGLLVHTAKSTFIEGIITLVAVYTIGVVVTRLLNHVIQQIREESGKNRDQYNSIKILNDTIQDASQKLTESISVTSDIINQFYENSQSQAAAVEELSASMEEISQNTNNVAEATGEQTSAITRQNMSIEDMTVSIEETEQSNLEISQMVESFTRLAEEGNKASVRLDRINNKILNNSNEILSVINIMEDFFARINLLSLNASIEAARAGEHGRGFAVVAEEIGKLSDNSSSELKQVSDLIGNNKTDVEEGNKVINSILTFIRIMLDNIREIGNKMDIAVEKMNDQKNIKEDINDRTCMVKQKSDFIETSMTEQKTGIDNVVISIEETNRIVQNNSQNTALLRESSDELKLLAESLLRKFDGIDVN